MMVAKIALALTVTTHLWLITLALGEKLRGRLS
jgi:hypothetical protein